MGTRSAGAQFYPFDWITEAIEITLNPDREFIQLLKKEEVERLLIRIDLEMWEIFNHLKAEAFYIFSPKKLNAIVQKYVNEVLFLKQQALANLEKYPASNMLWSTGKVIIESLSGLAADIETRYPGFVQQTASDVENIPNPPDPRFLKILCGLSIDQTGIILKAADDSRLIISRSLSLVFKSIVPYLSTQYKKDLSWDSMRSNSYHPEERDKDVAIEALEKMIAKIRDY